MTDEAVEADRIAEAFADALRRAEAEFTEMPGLRLTVARASRLWSFDSPLCTAVMSRLVEQQFLSAEAEASAPC